MPVPDYLRTPTFRLTALFSVLFACSTLILFLFIYWQTAIVETQRIDSALVRDTGVVAKGSRADVLRAVENRVTPDFLPITYAALFDADGRHIAGNIATLPAGVPIDGQAHPALINGEMNDRPTTPVDHVVIRRLANGEILAVARSIDSLDNLERVVTRALEAGVFPAVLLSLAAGAIVGRRVQRQVQIVHQTAERIMLGDFQERLPVRGTGDDFDRLADSVNRMLDEIVRLLDEVKSTGENIAHDLRTPLTRVRTRLERARTSAATIEELRDMIDRAIDGLDQTLRIITALLRISEIESGLRHAGFTTISLNTVVREIGDLYEPLAEERELRLVVLPGPTDYTTLGDRDLLSEALANLVDNAIKFTPPGGYVRLQLEGPDRAPVIRVVDSGPGIPPDERELVLKRFYRSDRSRHVDGSGLGLSLVAAIAKLHGFALAIGDNQPGCRVELHCGNNTPSRRSGRGA